jgi:hypothetical protein
VVDEAELVRDGLEPMGVISVGSELTFCDPSVPGGGLRRATRSGMWRLYLRADAEDADTIAEAVLVHPMALVHFWDRYDDAAAAGEVTVAQRRLAVVDSARAADTNLRAAMFEPDELPWLFDGGGVLETRSDGRVQLYVSANPALLVSLVFGAPATVIPGTVSLDDDGR